jgi:hypothetical protein
LTFGYIFKNPSDHRVIRLFMVSEPMLLRLPSTPTPFRNWMAIDRLA